MSAASFFFNCPICGREEHAEADLFKSGSPPPPPEDPPFYWTLEGAEREKWLQGRKQWERNRLLYNSIHTSWQCDSCGSSYKLSETFSKKRERPTPGQCTAQLAETIRGDLRTLDFDRHWPTAMLCAMAGWLVFWMLCCTGLLAALTFVETNRAREPDLGIWLFFLAGALMLAGASAGVHLGLRSKQRMKAMRAILEQQYPEGFCEREVVLEVMRADVSFCRQLKALTGEDHPIAISHIKRARIESGDAAHKAERERKAKEFDERRSNCVHDWKRNSEGRLQCTKCGVGEQRHPRMGLYDDDE